MLRRITTQSASVFKHWPLFASALARTQSSLSSSASSSSSLSTIATSRRMILLMPEQTKDPETFPLGYIPMDGRESPDTVYELLKAGHFVVADSKLEVADAIHRSVMTLAAGEFPAETLEDYEAQRSVKVRLLRRVLIKRDFWSYSDFNDPEANQSYGQHNFAFDNYRWSTQLWKEFQAFAEQHYPLSEHSHLVWADYVALQRYFKYKVDGMKTMPLMPRKHQLHPPFGVATPTLQQKTALLLYLTWLERFSSLLMIKKVLVVRCGCGYGAFATRFRGVPMVRGTDPQTAAIRGCVDDAKTLGYKYKDMSFEVAAMFPELDPHTLETNPNKHRYDLILFHWDVNPLPLDHDDEQLELSSALVDADGSCSTGEFVADNKRFAPGKEGLMGDLEEFFEQAGNYLTDNGVIAVATTNLHSLVYPDEPNPMELEVKSNRRWVILDYYDHAMTKGKTAHGGSFMTNKLTADSNLDVGTAPVQYIRSVRNQLRSELWVMHRVEALKNFGWLHKVPGCTPPSNVIGRWKYRTLQSHRMSVMKQRVEMMGMNWGEYKDRLLRALQDQGALAPGSGAEGKGGSEPEDDLAVSIRMAIDPTYPAEVAEQSRRIIEERERQQRRFHQSVQHSYSSSSSSSSPQRSEEHAERLHNPRDEFDQWSATLVPQGDATSAANAKNVNGEPTGAATAAVRKTGQHKKKKKKKEATRKATIVPERSD